MSQKDIAGVVIVAFETEISVADWLVAKFSPTPIPAAASPAITHMTARRIEVSLPRANQNQVKKMHLHRVPDRKYGPNARNCLPCRGHPRTIRCLEAFLSKAWRATSEFERLR